MADGSGFKIEVPVVVEPWRGALEHTAAYLETHGHCQDGSGSNGERRCVVLALWGLDQFVGHLGEAQMRLIAYLKARGWEGSANLNPAAQWSDATPTADIIEGLRDCARQP
jgi:hypothetical protein